MRSLRRAPFRRRRPTRRRNSARQGSIRGRARWAQAAPVIHTERTRGHTARCTPRRSAADAARRDRPPRSASSHPRRRPQSENRRGDDHAVPPQVNHRPCRRGSAGQFQAESVVDLDGSQIAARYKIAADGDPIGSEQQRQTSSARPAASDQQQRQFGSGRSGGPGRARRRRGLVAGRHTSSTWSTPGSDFSAWASRGVTL